MPAGAPSSDPACSIAPDVSVIASLEAPSTSPAKIIVPISSGVTAANPGTASAWTMRYELTSPLMLVTSTRTINCTPMWMVVRNGIQPNCAVGWKKQHGSRITAAFSATLNKMAALRTRKATSQ